MFKTIAICSGLFVVLLAVFVLVYTSTRNTYKSARKRMRDHYSLRAQIKRWEEEELNREIPREWMRNH